jgi:hypothetical protein
MPVFIFSFLWTYTLYIYHYIHLIYIHDLRFRPCMGNTNKLSTAKAIAWPVFSLGIPVIFHVSCSPLTWMFIPVTKLPCNPSLYGLCIHNMHISYIDLKPHTNWDAQISNKLTLTVIVLTRGDRWSVCTTCATLINLDQCTISKLDHQQWLQYLI